MQPLLFAAILLAVSIAAGADKASARLNVLYIVSDDLNNNLGCYGSPVVKSPNLDRLAARGVRFDRGYCNYPVCNASRTSFLSGCRPDTTRIVDNATPPRTFLKDAVFMPEYFRQQGYRTIKVGKIFHTGDQFEDPRSWDVDIREKKSAKNPPAEQILRKQGPIGIVLRAKDEDTWDGFVARKAVELLENCLKDGKPFFIAAGFRRPHAPYIAPEKYYAFYEPDKLKPRYGPLEHLANIPDLALTYRLGAQKFPETRPGDTIAAYYAGISFMDAQVGVLLDTLDRLKLWDRTVVVFHSDHGYHLGEHGGLWHKMCLFEETTRVPLIVAAPGKKSGVSTQLVELVDLYPTLADLCGLKIPSDLEGTSFVPLLDNPRRDWKRAVFTVVSRSNNNDVAKKLDVSRMGRTLFDGRWRYTEWPDGTAELYDHDSDPFEYANLVKDEKQAAQLAEIKKLLQDGWRAALPGK
ncbi:MAG: sulfatase [Verrucomicrobia bacterium]|nr:sulfatase [Verrucomicrobiota bacterium]